MLSTVAKTAAKAAPKIAEALGKNAGKKAAAGVAAGTALQSLIDASAYDPNAGFLGNMENVVKRSYDTTKEAYNLYNSAGENIMSGHIVEGLGDFGAGVLKDVDAAEGLVSGVITSTPLGGVIQRAESDLLGVDVGETRSAIENAAEQAKQTVSNAASSATGYASKVGANASAGFSDVTDESLGGLASAAGDVAGWAAGNKVYNTLMSTATGTLGTVGSVQSVGGTGSTVAGTSSTPAASMDDPSDTTATKVTAAQAAQTTRTASAANSAQGIAPTSYTATGDERAAGITQASQASGHYVGTHDDAMRASGIDQRVINREKAARGREKLGRD